LRAYANFDEEIGYTQGMNFIAGTILIILDPNNYQMSRDCKKGDFRVDI